MVGNFIYTYKSKEIRPVYAMRGLAESDSSKE